MPLTFCNALAVLWSLQSLFNSHLVTYLKGPCNIQINQSTDLYFLVFLILYMVFVHHLVSVKKITNFVLIVVFNEQFKRPVHSIHFSSVVLILAHRISPTIPAHTHTHTTRAFLFWHKATLSPEKKAEIIMIKQRARQ